MENQTDLKKIEFQDYKIHDLETDIDHLSNIVLLNGGYYSEDDINALTKQFSLIHFNSRSL